MWFKCQCTLNVTLLNAPIEIFTHNQLLCELWCCCWYLKWFFFHLRLEQVMSKYRILNDCSLALTWKKPFYNCVMILWFGLRNFFFEKGKPSITFQWSEFSMENLLIFHFWTFSNSKMLIHLIAIRNVRWRCEKVLKNSNLPLQTIFINVIWIYWVAQKKRNQRMIERKTFSQTNKMHYDKN